MDKLEEVLKVCKQISCLEGSPSQIITACMLACSTLAEEYNISNEQILSEFGNICLLLKLKKEKNLNL